MKKLLLIFLFAFTFTFILEDAKAQDRGFGVGAVIGSPDGLSYKAWISESAAIAGAVSFSISDNSSSFYTHADILAHKFYTELDWEVGVLHYYYGGGARLVWYQWMDDALFGVRLPSGIGFNFTEVPIDLFFEVAPTIDVHPDFNFGFNGALGFRFFLN